MKFRVIGYLFLFNFSFALVSCSLAEDITPPPDYQSPTSPPTLVSTSQIPDSTLGARSIASMESTVVATPSGSFSAGTESLALSTEAARLSVSSTLSFSGKVTNASGSALTGALTAHLYLYNTASSALGQTLVTEVQSDGEYQFVNVPAEMKTTYFVTVDFGGVTYTSDPLNYDGTLTTHNLPVTIYDTTNDLNSLSLTQIHMQFDFPLENKLQARMIYVVSNLGMKSVIVKSDGTSIPFIQIPAGATGVQYELAQGGTPLASATDGFALLPGADKQYGIVATFSLPYTRNLKLIQPFSLPVASETIIVPAGVRITSDQLADAGAKTYQGLNYQLYQGSNLASNSTLALTISGRPGDNVGLALGQQPAILIGVGAFGILLIGLGIFLFLRDRARLKLGVRDAGLADGSEPPSADNFDTISDAIIALDDQFKAGGIFKEAYAKRRDELKKRLRELA